MRGGNVGQLRTYNEHLVLSAILTEGSLSKAELSRRTGLSANAAMVIANELIARGLLRKCAPVRGQIGQPSTPIDVNPEGAYTIGVKIGRRRVQSLMVDLSGGIVAKREQRHAYPEPARSIATAIKQCKELLDSLDLPARDRVAGLGIALPGQLFAWTEELGLAPGTLDGWQEVDIRASLTAATGLETFLYNDASAACAAEMIMGDAIAHRSALYLFFGTFIGGGVVIGGRLYQGEGRNAGAIGSMPIAHGAGSHQLLHKASLLQLETLLEDHGFDPEATLSGEGSADAEPIFARWMEDAIPAVATAITSALSIIDFETVVIDGLMTPNWRRQMRSRIVAELGRQNLSGLIQPEIATGSIGPAAPMLGAAMMPLRTKFAPDPETLVRRTEPAR